MFVVVVIFVVVVFIIFFFQAEDGIRDVAVTGVQTCALPICFHDKYSAEFAQEYGNEWVKTLIAEEELKLSKKNDQ